MVTVGQSVIWVMVMVSLLGSPLCVCKVGEGPFSLNNPPNDYPAHLNYSILREGRQCDLFVLSVLVFPRHCLQTGRQSLCQFIMLLAGFMHSGSTVISGEVPGGWICDVVCCSSSDRSWSSCGMKSYDMKVYEMIWSDSYRSHGSYDSCI